MIALLTAYFCGTCKASSGESEIKPSWIRLWKHVDISKWGHWGPRNQKLRHAVRRDNPSTCIINTHTILVKMPPCFSVSPVCCSWLYHSYRVGSFAKFIYQDKRIPSAVQRMSHLDWTGIIIIRKHLKGDIAICYVNISMAQRRFSMAALKTLYKFMLHQWEIRMIWDGCYNFFFKCIQGICVNRVSVRWSHLVQVNHEGAQSHRYRLTAVHAGEDSVHKPDLCLFSGNIWADQRHEHNQTHLSRPTRIQDFTKWKCLHSGLFPWSWNTVFSSLSLIFKQRSFQKKVFSLCGYLQCPCAAIEHCSDDVFL